MGKRGAGKGVSPACIISTVVQLKSSITESRISMQLQQEIVPRQAVCSVRWNMIIAADLL